MQVAVLEFEMLPTPDTGQPTRRAQNPAPLSQDLSAHTKGGALALSCLSGLLGSSTRRQEIKWGGGGCNKTPPHGRQWLCLSLPVRLTVGAQLGVGLTQPECGYLCRLFLPPSPHNCFHSHYCHVRVVHTGRQLGLSKGLLRKPVKA